MTVSGRESGSLLEGAGEKLYFDSWEDVEAIFAGEALKLIRVAGETLGVTFTARDTWIKVTTSDPEKQDRALAFLKDLIRLQSMRGGPLTREDFQQVLNAAVDKRESDLQTYFAERINVSPKKRPVAPRTPSQLSYIRAIRRNDVVFGIGPAGTGKTYLAMAMAVSSLLEGKVDRIILTRPAVEAGENLGFLPGKLEEKIQPFLRPLYDALYDMLDVADVEDLTARNILEVAPLAFMRGRTLNNAFIILDEAQNTSKEQMLMFLTRLGYHSKCVVCGDPSQNDLNRRVDSGLLHAVRRLRHIEGIRTCEFSTSDVVRHSLVEKIFRAYEDDRHPQVAEPSEDRSEETDA